MAGDGAERPEERRSLPGRVFGAVVGSLVSPVVDAVDVDTVLDDIDINALVDRIDIGKVVERVDVNGLIEGIDVDALLERVDVNRLVERTELKAIIARSTTGLFSGVVDVARTQIITIDQAAQGLGAFVLRRPRGLAPGTPNDPADQPDLRSITRRERAVALQGHFAGSVSRFLAFLADLFVIGLLFGLGSLLVSSAIEVVFRSSFDAADYRLLVTALYVGWAFLYFAGSWATTGRTFGMALLGVMVVRADGADLGFARAAARTVCFPLSFLVFGAGLVLGLFRRDRRELHDLLAGTSVIYAWDAEEAQLRATAVAAAHPALATRRRSG